MKNKFQYEWVSTCTKLAWGIVPLFMAFLMTMVSFQNIDDRKILFSFAAILTMGISAYVHHKKTFENKSFFMLFPVILFMTICLRVFLFPHMSPDYHSFLRPWMSRMRFVGFPFSLSVPITNYNPLYPYILALLSPIPFPDVYLVKCVSVFFDCVLGVTVLFILKNCLKQKDAVNLLGFSLIMVIPSIFFNSSLWGQCESFYTALLMIGLYLCLRESPKKGCFFLGLAVAAKLQAAIVFPILVLFVAYRYLKVRHLFFILFAYILTLLPAIVFGRSIFDVVNIYLDQIGSNQMLSMDAPTFWAFFPNFWFRQLLPLALGVAATIILICTFFILIVRCLKDDADFWDVAFLYALIVPYFLPKMQDRYFYVSVVLSVIYLFRYPKLWPLTFGIILNDLFSYSGSLFGVILMETKWLSTARLLFILCVIWFLFQGVQTNGDIKASDLLRKEKRVLLSKWLLKGWYLICVAGVAILSYGILCLPFDENKGFVFNVQPRFYPYWISKKNIIMVEHPVWKGELIKLSDTRIFRPSVGDIGILIHLDDKEMIIRWPKKKAEQFIKDPETNIYIFQQK